MAACKRLVQLGPSSGISFTKFRRFSSSEKQFDGSSMIFGNSSSSNLSFNRFDFRQISQLVKPNGKRVFLVDTLALVRRLEAQGVPSKQAEAITAAITEVLNDSLENVAHSFVSKAEMQKTDMLHESNLSKFKTEVQSSQGGNDFEIYDSERTVGHTVKFIVGDLDITYNLPGAKEYKNGGLKKEVPNLEEVVVMEGVAHFLNQEKPEEISAHIVDFIRKL